MKKKVPACLLIFLSFTFCQAQTAADKNIQNLFDPNFRNITFLGMDFSMIKQVGDFSEVLGAGTEANTQTKNAYFKSWNNLVSGERDKYDIRELVKNKNIAVDIAAVTQLNSNTNGDDLNGYKEPDNSIEAIGEHVKQYNTTTGKGLGVVLLMECFNKNSQKATIDFIVIDMTTKKIVLFKKLTTFPHGSGLRNYWAGSIYDAFKEVEKNFVKVWKNEYNWN